MNKALTLITVLLISVSTYAQLSVSKPAKKDSIVGKVMLKNGSASFHTLKKSDWNDYVSSLSKRKREKMIGKTYYQLQFQNQEYYYASDRYHVRFTASESDMDDLFNFLRSFIKNGKSESRNFTIGSSSTPAKFSVANFGGEEATIYYANYEGNVGYFSVNITGLYELFGKEYIQSEQEAYLK